jgi:hypothetical protein
MSFTPALMAGFLFAAADGVGRICCGFLKDGANLNPAEVKKRLINVKNPLASMPPSRGIYSF